MKKEICQEQKRVLEHRHLETNWKKWGPYVSERAWGTVREDYSANGDSWAFFPHDQARSKATRWNEDGLAGISDRNQYFCLTLALWNGKDPILKERLFGLSNQEGNHGEDVKEYYFYLDNTPTHSYMQMLYKYPQKEYPYNLLIEENKKRGYFDEEYELIDTNVFDNNAYFDVFISYAKAKEDDILMKIEVFNRSEQEERCVVMPQGFFRNTWGFGYPSGPMNDVPEKPNIKKLEQQELDYQKALCFHPRLGRYFLFVEGSAKLIFTENETNQEKIFDKKNKDPYVKDSFHDYIIHGKKEVINPKQTGTKIGCLFDEKIPGNQSKVFKLRLTNSESKDPFSDFDSVFEKRKEEADDFYEEIQKGEASPSLKNVQRQAFAGMLWSKQLYYYDVERWLSEDRGKIEGAEQRVNNRNWDWDHFVGFDVLSMPDKWEYPWFASWDLAFHCLPLVLVDSDFAKRQLILMTREWYMHPNGQFPAYEWNFGDVNPPVHAWAAWRIYKIDEKQQGKPDTYFLEAIFHKLLLNFTWWVNKKDAQGNNVFQGGFLGMDNISIFNRSAPLPTEGRIDQADGSAWMSFYCLLMLKIALELSKTNRVYQDAATKFFEHFLRISYAMSNVGNKGYSLWDEEDGFFYDALHLPNNQIIPLKVRSLVGLLPLFAIETIEPSLLAKNTVFERRMEWFIGKRPDYKMGMACVYERGVGSRHLLAILTKERLASVLKYMLDENEFLSPYGIRSISKYHEKNPFKLELGGKIYQIDYEPGESTNDLFGGNSNWRGPIWFPINFLIIESLQKFHHYYGDSFQVEFPTGSGKYFSLEEVAEKLSQRLMKLFIPDEKGEVPVFGKRKSFENDPLWKNYIPFHEYFHGDTGKGLGASHQTGWTGLIAKLIQQSGESMEEFFTTATMTNFKK